MTTERPIPQWYNPQLKELLNQLFDRIEELERLQRLKVVRPKLPPPPSRRFPPESTPPPMGYQDRPLPPNPNLLPLPRSE